MSEASKRILWQAEYLRRNTDVGRVLGFRLCPAYWMVTGEAKPFRIELDDE